MFILRCPQGLTSAEHRVGPPYRTDDSNYVSGKTVFSFFFSFRFITYAYKNQRIRGRLWPAPLRVFLLLKLRNSGACSLEKDIFQLLELTEIQACCLHPLETVHTPTCEGKPGPDDSSVSIHVPRIALHEYHWVLFFFYVLSTPYYLHAMKIKKHGRKIKHFNLSQEPQYS